LGTSHSIFTNEHVNDDAWVPSGDAGMSLTIETEQLALDKRAGWQKDMWESTLANLVSNDDRGSLSTTSAAMRVRVAIEEVEVAR
jgi:hypothetical protein